VKEQPFRTGCFYWPRRGGPLFLAAGYDSWSDERFDQGEIRDELGHVADVGFDFVRVLLPWDSLQPDPHRLRGALLDRLGLILDAAGAMGLAVQLTLAGQHGGTLLLPQWLLATDPLSARREASMRLISSGWEAPWSPGDLYMDQGLLSAQRYVWKEIARNFAAHPALAELDPGAGGLLSAISPGHAEDALRWLEAVAEAARESDPVLPLLYSDGAALLEQGSLPRLDSLRDAVDHLAVAATPAASALARDGIDARWPEFLLLLARTLAHAPVGCAAIAVATRSPGMLDAAPRTEAEPGPLLYPEEEQARFFAEVLPNLRDLEIPLLCHAVWADAPTELYGQPPFDMNRLLRHSGLLRADGSEKEAANVWRSFHTRSAREEPARLGRDLSLDQEEWYQRRPDSAFLAQLYKDYRAGVI
jgi:hypothetical protein